MTKRVWKIDDKIVDLSKRGMIMGVLNITPDSFSDGGEFFETDAAVDRGIQVASEGADIIDIGGESTRPGAEPISVKEELNRVIPVIERLAAALGVKGDNLQLDPLNPPPGRDPLEEGAITTGEGRTLISIDTSKSEVASAALDAGASIINDVTAGRADEKIFPLA